MSVQKRTHLFRDRILFKQISNVRCILIDQIFQRYEIIYVRRNIGIFNAGSEKCIRQISARQHGRLFFLPAAAADIPVNVNIGLFLQLLKYRKFIQILCHGLRIENKIQFYFVIDNWKACFIEVTVRLFSITRRLGIRNHPILSLFC